MKYKVLGYFKREKGNMEGLMIQDMNTLEKYLTSGVMKWEATEDKINQITIVDQIDMKKFMEYWNRYIGRYNELVF